MPSQFTLLSTGHGGNQHKRKRRLGMGSPRLESWLCPLPGEEPSSVSEHWCGSSAAYLGQGYAGEPMEHCIKNAWKAVGA